MYRRWICTARVRIRVCVCLRIVNEYFYHQYDSVKLLWILFFSFCCSFSIVLDLLLSTFGLCKNVFVYIKRIHKNSTNRNCNVTKRKHHREHRLEWSDIFFSLLFDPFSLDEKQRENVTFILRVCTVESLLFLFTSHMSTLANVLE